MLILVLLITLPNVKTWAAQSSFEARVDQQGVVHVTDRWEQLEQESGFYDYFTATKEHRTLQVEVKDSSFEVTYETSSYWRYEDGMYHFVTPDFFYADAPLDVTVVLAYPDYLQYVDASAEPVQREDSVVRWELTDCEHLVLIARFKLSAEGAAENQQDGLLLNPTVGQRIDATELPLDADLVLEELEVVLKLSGRENAIDPDVLRALDRLLAKLFLLLNEAELLDTYELPPREEILVQ